MCSIPCECGHVYIGRTGRSTETRKKDYYRHMRLGHTVKSAVAEREVSRGHVIKFQDTRIHCTVSGYTDRLFREAIELEFNSNSMKREDRLTVSGSWNLLIRLLRESKTAPSLVATSLPSFEDHTMVPSPPHCNGGSGPQRRFTLEPLVDVLTFLFSLELGQLPPLHPPSAALLRFSLYSYFRFFVSPISVIIIIIIIIIIIFLHGLGRLIFSGIDALPSFPGASTICSSSRFVVEGVFRESGVVHSFKMVDPVLFVFESHALYSSNFLPSSF